MLLLGPKVLLFLAVFIIPSGEKCFLIFFSDDVTPVTPETFTEDPKITLYFFPTLSLFPNSFNPLFMLLLFGPLYFLCWASSECWDEKFTCTRLYSVRRPIQLCIHQSCFIRFRRTYVVNKEICSRLVCKEHEAMKDELCRQMVGLPPRRLRRSNYFLLNPCENVDSQKPNGL
uniref:Microfibril associated protein 5 n=1 Tax=Callithrix jacchus TaxID=9483 RepID=A0A2R8MGN1_CALJA